MRYWQCIEIYLHIISSLHQAIHSGIGAVINKVKTIQLIGWGNIETISRYIGSNFCSKKAADIKDHS